MDRNWKPRTSLGKKIVRASKLIHGGKIMSADSKPSGRVSASDSQAALVEEIARLRVENSRFAKALRLIAAWKDEDCSRIGMAIAYEAVRVAREAVAEP